MISSEGHSLGLTLVPDQYSVSTQSHSTDMWIQSKWKRLFMCILMYSINYLEKHNIKRFYLRFIKLWCPDEEAFQQEIQWLWFEDVNWLILSLCCVKVFTVKRLIFTLEQLIQAVRTGPATINSLISQRTSLVSTPHCTSSHLTQTCLWINLCHIQILLYAINELFVMALIIVWATREKTSTDKSSPDLALNHTLPLPPSAFLFLVYLSFKAMLTLQTNLHWNYNTMRMQNSDLSAQRLFCIKCLHFSSCRATPCLPKHTHPSPLKATGAVSCGRCQVDQARSGVTSMSTVSKFGVFNLR